MRVPNHASRRARTIAALSILSLLALVPCTASASAVAARGAVVGREPQPFAADSVWNEPLPARAPLDRRSATYVADLVSQATRDGAWINTYAYSTPVFVVPHHQRTVTVKLDPSNNRAAAALARSWRAVPIPAGARPASGSDEHMVVWQPSTDRMWEFWKMRRARDGWHAKWGGTIDDVSSNPGYYAEQPLWGATATSLPLLGGLIRPEELAAGHIDHALAIGIPAARAAYFAWPAQRTDGYVWSGAAIPEGQRFRLDPRLDLSRIPLSPIVRMIAVAAQRYGIVVRDQAGAVTFYAQDTEAEHLPDPYDGAGGFFGGQSLGQLLKSFPWSHLQALKDTLHCCWHS